MINISCFSHQLPPPSLGFVPFGPRAQSPSNQHQREIGRLLGNGVQGVAVRNRAGPKVTVPVIEKDAE